MRSTYTAFGLLALASSNALGAPTSIPELGGNSPTLGSGSDMASFPSSAPTSPDVGSGDMAAFPSFSSLEYELPDLAGLTSVGEDKQLSQDAVPAVQPDAPDAVPSDDGPAAVPGLGQFSHALQAHPAHENVKEYEQWLQKQKDVAPTKMAEAKMVDTSDTAVPETSSQDVEDSSTQTAERQSPPPSLANIEKLGPSGAADGKTRKFLSLAGRAVPTLPDIHKSTDSVSMPALAMPQKEQTMIKKLAPARIRNQRREADTLADYMHMNHPHAELSNIPSRPQQVAALARKMRRATVSEVAPAVKVDHTMTEFHKALHNKVPSPLAAPPTAMHPSR